MACDLGLHVRKNPPQFTVGIDNVRLSVGKGPKAGNREGAAVFFGNHPALVGEHEKIEFFFGAKLRVLFHRIDADAHHLGVQLAVRFQVFLEPPCLERAAAGKGSRVEIEDGPLGILHQRVQRHQTAAAGVGEFELGGLCALGGETGVGRLGGGGGDQGRGNNACGTHRSRGGSDKGTARRYRFGNSISIHGGSRRRRGKGERDRSPGR
mmetsp:Transcript_26966/g.59273  ORF Transcript_26966/g.59273 Transcript_26966/m.59273 type:complete len:209 (+) Transcript_26966:223-849(+)